ncbi:metallophosphatase domain-containing protein [Aspergillus stella-maris]|uniref:metallophosphatase domain-containing protein n=1 Tax=Aspergillus stella-maris TaxID=1810926 RepID=UPI003CCD85A1
MDASASCRSPASTPNIKTRFLVISDTHGHQLPPEYFEQQADVVIHCADLTTKSRLDEFRSAIKLLQKIHAPIKLVIAGNHDFTLDIPIFKHNVSEVTPTLEPDLVKRKYGDYGERHLSPDEDTHHFTLHNGASLKVYASPFTTSLGNWGFQYHTETGHNFEISNDVDITITHGPPKGIMDTTNSGDRAGCPRLLEAVARSRPRVHCFGHIHEGWGAKLVAWRPKISEKPSHFTDIDHGRSKLLARLSQTNTATRVFQTSHCSDDQTPLIQNSQTLFVNAAVEGTEDLPAAA